MKFVIAVIYLCIGGQCSEMNIKVPSPYCSKTIQIQSMDGSPGYVKIHCK